MFRPPEQKALAPLLFLQKKAFLLRWISYKYQVGECVLAYTEGQLFSVKVNNLGADLDPGRQADDMAKICMNHKGANVKRL